MYEKQGHLGYRQWEWWIRAKDREEKTGPWMGQWVSKGYIS